MKNRRWFRLAGWLLTLVMILTVIPAATFAEEENGNVDSNYLKPTGGLLTRPAEVDITDSVTIIYKDEDGNIVTAETMNPNKENQMTLTVSGLNGDDAIVNETAMTVTLPKNIKITASAMQAFSNDAVNASLADGKLTFSWKGEKQDAIDATFAVQPQVKAEDDLSGSYALVTKVNVMVGATTYNDAGRDKLKSFKAIVKDGKLEPESGVRSFWTLKHISGDYYTVYNQNAKKYLKIVLPNHATLEKTSEESAQKILVQKTSDGYYTFRYEGVGLNNSGNNATKGFASYKAGNADNEKFKLFAASNVVYNDKLAFDINAGSGDTAPATITAEAGTLVTLPSLSATKSGQEFIGWADVKDFYSKVSGTNHTYHDLYAAGTSYTMKPGENKLYAVYNSTTKKVQFGIRKDGIIQDEPNGYPVNAYCGHFSVDGILKDGHWVIDIDSTKPVNDYYVQNDVIAALNFVPTAEQIAAALKKEGNIDFDPETQYIHYYVLKNTSATVWKVDGVIRDKANVEITYDANVPGTEKTEVTNLPGAYQVAPGTDIMIGADQGSTEIKRPGRKGYYFMGWNTEKDGSGTYYNENRFVHMTQNLYLYAQWISEEDEVLEIRITSDWPAGKTGHIGDKITLSAELTGFENKEYTLKWQYSTDLENWTDVPDAHDITYTYTLDETTTHYTWRAVAEDIR